MASIKLKGDTSGEVTISAPAVAGTTTLELPATSSTLATQNSLGVRNLIINGDMNIAQRGTSASGITTTGYHTVDRWSTLINSTGTWTQTQDTDVPTGQGFGYSLKLQCTTADASLGAADEMFIRQPIESQNLTHLAYGTSSAKTLTLSFWVKSNKTGTYIAEMQNYNATATRIVSNAITISSADTWEKKTWTFAGDTAYILYNNNAAGMRFVLWLATGSNRTSGTLNTTWATAGVDADRCAGQTVNLADSTSNYINITGVQLEVGDTATEFEHRPYDMELARCQRYYEAISKTYIQDNICNAHCWNTTTAYGVLQYSRKRAAPSVTLTATDYIVRFGGTTNNVTGSNISQMTVDRCQFGLVTSGLTIGYGAWLAFDSDAVSDQKLEISAEL